MSTRIQQLRRSILALIVLLCLLTACKKDDATKAGDAEQENHGNPESPAIATLVHSSASGFVTDEYNHPVGAALVKMGSVEVSTDTNGYFEIRNVDVIKNVGVISIKKTGYFNGTKTFVAAEGKAAFFRIRLIPKVIAGTISGTSGGEVSLVNGLKVGFPSNAISTASSGAPYPGVVNVASYWIDPTSAGLAEEMPGDLRGIDTNGDTKILTSFGMAAVELTGSGGELLQITSGQKATLTVPVPTSLNGSAPPTIPLWSFDETRGLWKQEGVATKSGDRYVGDVSHFSFWNYDLPASYVPFNCTVVDAEGASIPFAAVKISVVGSPGGGTWGWTDSSGYVSGAIPANSSLRLEVYNNFNCSNPLYTQNFNSQTNTIALGNIIISSVAGIANISGSVKNCAGGPVTNGYVQMKQDGQLFRYSPDTSGNYHFNSILCSSFSSIELTAVDFDSMQQSTVLLSTITSGTNTMSNLYACGIAINEFFTYSINGGTQYVIAAPIDTIYQYGSNPLWEIEASGREWMSDDCELIFYTNNIAVGSSQQAYKFYSWRYLSVTYGVGGDAATGVRITELGNIGEHIAGTFSFTMLDGVATYLVTGSFRVRRSL